MPRLRLSFPKYRRHKPWNLAVVSLDGRMVYLGPWKSARSRELYDQLIALWLKHGRTLPDEVLAEFATGEPDYDVHVAPSRAPVAPTPLSHQDNSPAPPASRERSTTLVGITLAELAARYDDHARTYYRKNGRTTREAELVSEALAVAVELFGAEPAAEFGPLRFQQVRDVMIARGWSRNYINKQCGRIKRAFRWAVSRELVPPAASHALHDIEGLKQGRSNAPESAGVEPVDRDVVDATIPHLNAVVADMVRLQLATGARPGEIRDLRPCDVDRRDPACWVYRPQTHKMEHRGTERIIFIGPRGQDMLRPYLLRPPTEYCFCPTDAVKKVRSERAVARKTPPSCGNSAGTNRKRSPQRPAGRQYSKDSYNRAIRRACEAAGVQHWHANQLRHLAATEIRQQFGLEAAQVVLGHARADVTQVYAERDQQKARDVMRQVG